MTITVQHILVKMFPYRDKLPESSYYKTACNESQFTGLYSYMKYPGIYVQVHCGTMELLKVMMFVGAFAYLTMALSTEGTQKVLSVL